VQLHQREEERAINCPDCGKVAEIVRLGTLELDLCVACGGLWFDRNELERLPKEVSPADLSGEMHALVARLAARRCAPKAYPLCPICHESMNLAQYQKVSGVVVHRCVTCGVWLDGNNAAKFFLLFEAGRMALPRASPTSPTYIGRASFFFLTCLASSASSDIPNTEDGLRVFGEVDVVVAQCPFDTPASAGT
jgi:Zn-finger nucleic acid-binding protein